MHTPGHFRPFTDFLNQGMNQTVNTVNSPNINQPAAPMQPSPPTQPSFGGEIPGSNTMPGQINPNLPIQPSVPQPSGPQPFELTQLDLNADGMLNEQELLNSITSTQNPEIYNILNNLISQMGGNLSGGVSMDELLQAYLSPQAPEFTGGGGMGGQLARQLYYPSTTGGFASAGSGITGGQSNIHSLLTQLGR